MAVTPIWFQVHGPPPPWLQEKIEGRWMYKMLQPLASSLGDDTAHGRIGALLYGLRLMDAGKAISKSKYSAQSNKYHMETVRYIAWKMGWSKAFDGPYDPKRSQTFVGVIS